MHWLIPVVSHTASCAYSLLGQSITPAALVLSVGLVAAQSFHPWGGFYLSFAVFFIVSNATAIALRYTGKGSPSSKDNALYTTTRYLLANTLLAAVLVPLHHYYLAQRMKMVKWFLLDQAPDGCLPVPSRSILQPANYKFQDALANQLPFAIVASYTAATANVLSTSLGGTQGFSILQVVAGAMGAVLVAFTGAHTLPMCEGRVEGAEHVMASVDRAPVWNERTEMEWTDQGRYRDLVVLMTLAGTVGVVIERVVRSMLQGKAEVPKQANGSVQKGKQAAKGAEEVNQNGPLGLSSFVMNVVVTGSVVLGMALWSYLGAQPRPVEEYGGVPGLENL